MKKKKLLVATFAALYMSQASFAVPAYPGLIKVKQADGTEISIRLHGDEHGNYTTTEDGYPLVFNDATKNYEYVALVNGEAKCSGIVASDASLRTNKAKSFLATVDKSAIINIYANRRKENLEKFNSMMNARKSVKKASNSPSKILTNNFPHTGEQHSIVILMEFNDKQFSTVDNAQQYYTDVMNKEGFTAENGANGSCRDYFIASSNGAFKPTFDVYGPVQIDYGQHDAGQGTYDTPINMGTFVKAAVEAIDSQVDFSQYDHDGDGYVDNVYIYYAGKGAADSTDGRTIWPHAFNMVDWGVDLTTDDGVKIGSYTCSNEVDGQRPQYPAGIGTFVHEFGHCLGLADHYDTANSYNRNTPGAWDVMDQGSYNNNSNTPPLYSSYERYELGWIEPEVITSTTKGTFSLQSLGESNKAYKVDVPGKENEYFLFENRQRNGWDSYLPSSGMLVWHIDMDEDIWNSNTVNNNASHQRVDIVEANGMPSGYESSSSGVPFPGAYNMTSYSFTSWNNDVVFDMDKVNLEDGVVSFIAKGGDANLTAPELSIIKTGYNTIDCSWNKVDDADSYLLNVSRVNSDNTLTALEGYTDKKLTDTKCTIEGLEQETEYEISVKSSAGAFRSDESKLRVITITRPFTTYKVENVQTSDITGASFTASWDAVENAQTYNVSLSKKTYDGELATTSYDFTNKKPGLPYGWATSSTYYSSAEGSYGEAGPSLRFGAKGHYLQMKNQDAVISKVSFWMKPSKVSDASYIEIQRLVDDEWADAQKVAFTESEGKVYSFDIEPATSVRLYFNRVGSDYVFIDDVTVNGNKVTVNPVSAYTDKNVGNVQKYTFIGLEPQTTYILNVYGLNNGEKTLASDDLVITTSDASSSINGIVSEGRNKHEVYDLTGRRISKNSVPSGMYIIRGNGKTVKIAK